MSYPNFTLTGKKTIVTGASTGIGKGIALAMADAGADVLVTSRTLAKAEPVAAEIRAMGRQAVAYELDVRQVANIDAMMATAQAEFGRIDVLVNNAGINIIELAFDVTEAHWDDVQDTNLRGLFFCCQRAGQIMRDQGGGKIINIGSQMGSVGGFNRAAYCASKGGVVNLTRVLAIEWAEHKILVNTVAPTFIETPLTTPQFEDEAFHQEVISKIPLGRVGDVQDVSGAVIFLASSAADLITGHTLLVDGGWTAW
jgi:2-deoxy-D-gluconate 3-dehydrogenase